MELLIDLFIALVGSLLLLGSGAWIFGSKLGGLARGATVPLLVVPLVADWTRYLFKIPFTISFGCAVGLYLVFALLCELQRRKSEAPFRVDPNWWLALIILLAIHVLLRLWIVTERGPNPADDTFGGYKAQALLHSISWPAIHPEAPDLTISYYYFGYAWPAALAALGVSLKAGWWVTAIALCVTGGMLVLELVVPKIQNRRDAALAAMTVAAGCSWSFLLGLVQRLPPRAWLQEGGYLTAKFGLYMRVPETTGGYWAPFNVLSTGILIVATMFLLEFIRGRWEAARFVWSALAIGSLAGYCTFDLLGFILVVVPALTLVAWRHPVARTMRRWIVYLIVLGICSILLTLPLLLDLAQRQTATRYDRFRDPLLVWLQSAFEKFSIWQVTGLGLWVLAASILANILLLPLWRRLRNDGIDPETSTLLGIFGMGTFLCFFGVTDDFVPKFGLFVATALIVAFLRSGPWVGWDRRIWLAGLVGPMLLVLNGVRANLATPRWDPVWHTIDTITAVSGEWVLYDIAYSERRKRIPWQNVLPFYSRARFLVPAEQVDDQGQNFLQDPAALAILPPIKVRLAQLAGKVPSYLLLTTPDQTPAGEELYRSDLFSLQRVTQHATVAPLP